FTFSAFRTSAFLFSALALEISSETEEISSRSSPPGSCASSWQPATTGHTAQTAAIQEATFVLICIAHLVKGHHGEVPVLQHVLDASGQIGAAWCGSQRGPRGPRAPHR